VHTALQQLLRDRPSQAELQRWQAATRSKRIEAAAWRPLAGYWANADPVLRRLLQLESRRLEQLLADFVDEECGRESFTIEAVEQSAELRRGPVTLNLRIDRVDRLADGSLLIIDYKAGVQRPFMDKKRGAPAHLQLCVYARALQGKIGGLTLLYVNSREIGYVGDGGSIAWGKTKTDDWPDVLAEWCREVDVLLTRFAAGEIGVSTVQKHEDARPLAVLSRIAELAHAQ